ncbi:hypothetical protein BC940DRAFT_288845 [Gongronella butleri]|nr:hypothetical protein BC940DRAFT_288845 [Gongronella butleri]
MSANNFTKNTQPFGAHSASNANSNNMVTHLTCSFCSEEKLLSAFSKTQVMKATYNPYAPPGWNNKKKVISCKACTAGQNTKMKCMTCEKVQPLENYAKSQRKHADKARCLKCMKKREEEDVWNSASDSDDSDPEGKWADFL